MAVMQRTSESIATLAAALAKAQIELVNPEKTLVATIPASDRSGAEKMFRYASLSSGLEIVRKVLGQHQIATVQTTSIDQAAGIVNLTTVLAHSSGEWIASDWPVCPVAETDSPRRMGAALTYLGAMPFLPWSGSPVRTILMRLTSWPPQTSQPLAHEHRRTAAANSTAVSRIKRQERLHIAPERDDGKPPPQCWGQRHRWNYAIVLSANSTSLARVKKPRSGRIVPFGKRTD